MSLISPSLAQRIEQEVGVRSVHFDALLRPAGDGSAADSGFARLDASVERLAAALRR